MLRAMGSQRSGHETDNIESMRDLSGRRVRHVNDEKKVPLPRSTNFQLRAACTNVWAGPQTKWAAASALVAGGVDGKGA